MPDSDQLSSFYPAEYHSMSGGGLLKQIRHDLRMRRLKGLAKGKCAWLDYGCGDGSFLVQAAQRMPENEYYGFEISQHRKVVELAGGAVTVVQGALEDLLEVLPPCRLITMNHVIEHLPGPAEVVSKLVAKLVPGGVFEGQTPNSDSLEHVMFRGNWSGYHAPRHTVVFSRRGMRSLLLSAGLTEIRVNGAFNPAALAVSLASIFQAGTGGRISRQGPKWLASLGMATVLAPLDLFSGAPGVINFIGRKKAN
jgi:SAM-dependent methyltransferase